MTAAIRAEARARSAIASAWMRGRPLYRHPDFPTQEVTADAVRPGDTVADAVTGAALAVVAVGRGDGLRLLYTRPLADLDGAPTRKLRYKPDAILSRALVGSTVGDRHVGSGEGKHHDHQADQHQADDLRGKPHAAGGDGNAGHRAAVKPKQDRDDPPSRPASHAAYRTPAAPGRAVHPGPERTTP